jgi:hypothetical protein
MSKPERLPPTHHILVDAPLIVGSPSFGIPTLRVINAKELPAALAQREKTIVIEGDKLTRPFSWLAYWQEARWWFIAWLVYRVLTTIIANQYHLDAEWHLSWKIERTFDGKITLTPTAKYK